MTAPQALRFFLSHGPKSSDDKKTQRRLGTFEALDGEHARSADLILCPCEQYHSVFSNSVIYLLDKPTF